MQWLAAICVRRPVFTWVLMAALVVVGSASIFGLGVDRFPNIDFPVVVVTTVLPGASPEQIETEVSDKIEEALNSISGVDELRSNSYEGLSVVIARFDLDKSTTVAAQEVRDRVNRTLALLPSGIEQPKVERMDPDAAPVMLIALESTRTTREATEFATRRIRRRIESLSGVGGVSVLGGYYPEPVTVQGGSAMPGGTTVANGWLRSAKYVTEIHNDAVAGGRIVAVAVAV